MGEPIQHGVPVYDEAGALFADSVSAAARLLGCRPHNLLQNRLRDYRDGYQLTGRPRRNRVTVSGADLAALARLEALADATGCSAMTGRTLGLLVRGFRHGRYTCVINGGAIAYDSSSCAVRVTAATLAEAINGAMAQVRVLTREEVADAAD